MTRRKIAPPEEVLEALTEVLRAPEEEVRLADRFKAAELLGKHYGLFDPKEERQEIPAEAAARVEALVRLAAAGV